MYNEAAPGRLVLFLAAARRPEACTAGAAPDALASLDEGHLRTWRLGDGGAQVRRRRGSPGPVTPTTRLRSSLRSCAAARRAGRALIEVPARAL